MRLTGGCLCGAVRFTVDGEPNHVLHCHCSMCRKATGAVVATFANFDRDRVAWSGAPARYESSAIAWRAFCPRCGTALSYTWNERPERVAIAVGAFDDPAALAATAHVFGADRLPWLHVDEHLPDVDE